MTLDRKVFKDLEVTLGHQVHLVHLVLLGQEVQMEMQVQEDNRVSQVQQEVKALQVM